MNNKSLTECLNGWMFCVYPVNKHLVGIEAIASVIDRCTPFECYDATRTSTDNVPNFVFIHTYSELCVVLLTS